MHIINDETFKKLLSLAKKKTEPERETFDGSIYDMCGGNYDDAYYLGTLDGEIILAREILASMGIKA